jgi:broad specificity phosphatase PhoE
MTKVLVIRHGPTDWNEAGLIQGRTDRSLSEAGREQIAAMRLPDEWAGTNCLASPLQRTIATARLLGLDPKPEPRLIEMAWGEWEGKGLKDLRAEYTTELAAKEAMGLDFRPPGGESPRDVQVRLRTLLSEVQAPTIFVTHKGVLRALYALATGWDMTSDPPQKLHNGRAHSFDISLNGTPSVHELNIALAARR